MRGRWLILLSLTAGLLGGCATPQSGLAPGSRHFTSFTNFSQFSKSSGDVPGETAFLSPEIVAPNPWDELVVSWNVPPGVYLTIEARAVYPDHSTKFYTLGSWRDDPAKHPRQSKKGQADADGDVLTDTLVLKRPVMKTQLRLTAGGGSNGQPLIKFIGLSFCDRKKSDAPRQPLTRGRASVLDVVGRVQSGYEGPGGWCSAASLSMVLAYWSTVLHRPELDRSVPDVAAGVNDPVYGGTGNWPFNTAYAGEFPGLRAYVTRLDDLGELEQWIDAGVPVVMSVSSYLTEDRQVGRDNGHLIVCVGFTDDGDVVVNDPGVSLRRGEKVRRIYPRERVINAWKKSRNTVYLVYPETITIPEDSRGHWEHGENSR